MAASAGRAVRLLTRTRALPRAMLAAATLALAGWSGACSHASSTTSAGPAPAAASGDSLIIYHAGSLTTAFRVLADSFAREHPGGAIRLEAGGSVAMARRAQDRAHAPDVLALADYAVIPRLLMPEHTAWYAAFARNAMVLVFTDRSRKAAEIGSGNWMDVLLRPGVRSGHSDPAQDPAGYRARLVFALAERYYRRPGLTAALDAAVPILGSDGRNVLDLLRAGELDYVVAYRTTGHGPGLKAVELPREIDLSDPALAADYATASIRVARPGGDSVEIRGEPIQYGVTVLRAARHGDLGVAFVRLLFGPVGRGALEAEGFIVPPRPTLEGRPPAGLGVRYSVPDMQRVAYRASPR